MYLYCSRPLHAPSLHGNFCTQCRDSVMHTSAITMRPAVQKRRPYVLRTGRTACSPSGPPTASERPRTNPSEFAGSSGTSFDGAFSSGVAVLIASILPYDSAARCAPYRGTRAGRRGRYDLSSATGPATAVAAAVASARVVLAGRGVAAGAGV